MGNHTCSLIGLDGDGRMGITPRAPRAFSSILLSFVHALRPISRTVFGRRFCDTATRPGDVASDRPGHSPCRANTERCHRSSSSSLAWTTPRVRGQTTSPWILRIREPARGELCVYR